jgi:hypothetical protein
MSRHANPFSLTQPLLSVLSTGWHRTALKGNPCPLYRFAFTIGATKPFPRKQYSAVVPGFVEAQRVAGPFSVS